MTETEIIKALEVCVGIHNDCENCPLLEHSQATDECMTEVMSNALVLINRQRAEIERLVKILDDKCDRCIEKERAEAIKGFAEGLKDHSRKMQSSDFSGEFWDRAVLVSDIDNLVKEMLGDTK